MFQNIISKYDISFGKSTHKIFYITRLYKDDQSQIISFNSSLFHSQKIISSSSVFQYPDFSSNSSLNSPQDTASSQLNSAFTSLIIPKVHDIEKTDEPEKIFFVSEIN